MENTKWNMGTTAMSWAQGRINGFITSVLRSGMRRWPPKYQTLQDSFAGKKLNTKTNRIGAHYRCAYCRKDFPSKDVQIDHIEPVVDPKVGFVSWDVFISRLFVPKEKLQTLCVKCHKKKTLTERIARSKK